MRLPEAILFAVGDELVTGRRVDRNGVRLAAWLEAKGYAIRGRMILPDREPVIAQAIRDALATDVDLVVVSGGMGPTLDDRTREGLAEGLGVALQRNDAAWQMIEARYRERGLEIPPHAARQAYQPEGAELLANPVGTAPGLFIDRGRQVVVALPGVTRELEQMLERSVQPRLGPQLASALVLRTGTLHVAGLEESDVDRRIRGALGEGEDGFRVTLLPAHGEVEVLVRARSENEEEAEEALRRALAALEARLGDYVYGRDDETLVGAVRRGLERRGWTLGVVESITGGLVAKTIVDQPGSGEFFVGALVPYADECKPGLLDVDAAVLERHGVVSAECARLMAEAAREQLGSDVGLATTGIAGPAGGSQERPVGLTYLAVSWPDRTIVRRHVLHGDRNAIRTQAAVLALDQVRRSLGGLPPLGDPAEAPERG